MFITVATGVGQSCEDQPPHPQPQELSDTVVQIEGTIGR